MKNRLCISLSIKVDFQFILGRKLAAILGGALFVLQFFKSLFDITLNLPKLYGSRKGAFIEFLEYWVQKVLPYLQSHLSNLGKG